MSKLSDKASKSASERRWRLFMRMLEAWVIKNHPDIYFQLRQESLQRYPRKGSLAEREARETE